MSEDLPLGAMDFRAPSDLEQFGIKEPIFRGWMRVEKYPRPGPDCALRVFVARAKFVDHMQEPALPCAILGNQLSDIHDARSISITLESSGCPVTPTGGLQFWLRTPLAVRSQVGAERACASTLEQRFTVSLLSPVIKGGGTALAVTAAKDVRSETSDHAQPPRSKLFRG
jgi:hypothetical protein